MTQFDNTNRGALFRNERKEPGDKKPEYTGSLNVDGVEYFLDAWLNESQGGKKFMRVSIKRKDKQAAPQAKPAPSRGGSGFDDMSDDVPF